MAKKKNDDIFNFLAKVTKAEVLSNTTPVKYFIDTGNLAFNWTCSGKFMGGGIPGGRITEFYGSEGSGKCISEDMEVFLSDGRVMTIKEIVESKDVISVISLNEKTNRLVPTVVDQFWNNGKKPCWEVTTRTGRKVTTTGNHKYLTPDGWKYLSNIKKGDFVAVPKRMAFFGNTRMNEDELKYIAYMLAEGCCVMNRNRGKNHGYSSNFTNTDPVLIDDFRESAKKLGINFYRDGITDFLSGNAKSILRDYEIIGHSAKTKIIPQDVFSCPKDQVVKFLNIFFSCDGYINANTNNIELTLANEKLIRQIGHLLLRFGIVHSIAYKVATCQGKKFDSWRLSINSQEYRDLFLREINFISVKKKNIPTVVETGMSYLDKFPYQIAEKFCNELEKEYSNNSTDDRALKVAVGGNRVKSIRQQLKKKQPLMRLSFSNVNDDSKVYNKYMNADILWDEVMCIKSVDEKSTYDLGIKEHHNFIANNCLVHNTYWGCNVVRGCQAIGGIPVYLDCENSLNNEWIVKTSHIDLDKVLVFDPSNGVDSLEGCFDKIYSTIRNLREKDPDTPLVFVYDSLSASPSSDEIAETQKDWNPEKKDQPGVRARICSKEFRKLNTLLEKTNCTLLILNQTRLKIGVMYGNPIISGGGGESLKFYASLRVCTAVQKKIENKKLGTAMGINLKVRNVKNRCTAPFLEAEGVQLFWKDGVNPLSGLLTALIQSARIEKAGNGTYQVMEPWAGGAEIKFRASKARNDMDAETLYKCPALVDAKDEQELRDYVSIFGSAIGQSENEENEEFDAKDLMGEDYA